MSVIALSVGGFLGAVLRFGLGEWIPVTTDGFPLGTVLVNLLGCLFLGWFFTHAKTKWLANPEVRIGVGTGMTGAFTTFSTFSVQTVDLLEAGKYLIATGYVLSSVVGGLTLTMVGVKYARFQRRDGGAA